MASEWDELTLISLGALSDWIFGYISEAQAKTLFFISACRNLPIEILRKTANSCMRSTDQDDIGQFAELLGLVEDFRKYPSLSKSLITEFKGLNGPINNFSNFTWEQYGLADAFFSMYLKERAEDDLNELLSIIYRSSTFDGEPCSKALEIFQAADMRDKSPLLLNFMGLRRHLIDQYGWIFPAQDPALVAEGAEPDLDPYWSQRITRQLSGPEFGSFDQINKMKAHSVLWVYNEELKNAKP